MKAKPNIILLYGGRGCESEVSIQGARYLATLIPPNRYHLIPILIDKRGEWFIHSPTDTRPPTPEDSVYPVTEGGCAYLMTRGGKIPVDAAFPLLHGDYGEDGIIQGALAAASIPYVGADNYLGPLAMDKAVTKMVAESLGIPTARYVLGIRGTSYNRDKVKALSEERLGYPMFIKPARLGSSFGARRVMREDEFCEAYDEADALSCGRVLIEELVDIAAEAECAVFRVQDKEIITDFGAILCDGFYDYNRKYIDHSGVSISDKLMAEGELLDLMRDYAHRLSEYLGIRHLSRIDFFITRDGRALFNEINTMPGFTEGSLYPRLLSRAGINPSSAICDMLDDILAP